jgi:hypothetical protein
VILSNVYGVIRFIRQQVYDVTSNSRKLIVKEPSNYQVMTYILHA